MDTRTYRDRGRNVDKQIKKIKITRNIQIPVELIKTGGMALIKELHKLINAIWRKEELPKEWKTSIIVLI